MASKDTYSTKVTYDVKEGVNNIEQLADATKRAASDSEKSLSKIGSAVEGLGSRLGGMGNHAGTAFKALSGLGAVGGSIAGVAASVAGLALTLVSVKTLLRDIVADGKAFDAAVGKNLSLQKTLVELESAPGDAALGNRSRELRAKMSELASAKDASAQMKSLIAQETAARQAAYRQASSAANSYYSDAKALQQQLNGLTDAKATSTGSVRDILQLAKSATREGDTSRVQSLIAAAKQAAQAKGNNSSDLQDIGLAERNLEKSIRGRLEATKLAQAAATQQATGEKAALARLAQFAAKQQEVQRAQATQTTNQRNENRELTTLSELNKLGEAAAKSTLDQAAALKQLNNAQQDSAKPGFKDGFFRAMDALIDPTQLKAFRDQFSEAESLGDRITKALNVDSSAANIRKLSPEISKLGKLIEGFEGVKGGIPAGFTTGVDRVQRMEEALRKLSDGAAQQIKNTPSFLDQLQQLEGDPLAGMLQSSRGVAEALASAAASAKQIASLGSSSPSATTTAAISAASGGGAGSDAAAVAVAGGPQTINVPVTISGGLITQDVLNQISAHLQRSVRLGLA